VQQQQQQQQQQPAASPFGPDDGLPEGVPALEAVQTLVDMLWSQTPALAEAFMSEERLAALGAAIVDRYGPLMTAVRLRDEAGFLAVLDGRSASGGAAAAHGQPQAEGHTNAQAPPPQQQQHQYPHQLQFQQQQQQQQQQQRPVATLLPRPEPQPQHVQNGGSGGAVWAPGAGDLRRLVALCGAVWPPHESPLQLLRGRLAELLLLDALALESRGAAGADDNDDDGVIPFSMPIARAGACAATTTSKLSMCHPLWTCTACPAGCLWGHPTVRQAYPRLP
jgi:hypothetical protein